MGVFPTSSKGAVSSSVFEFWLVQELVCSMEVVQAKFIDQHLVVSREFLEKEYKKVNRKNIVVTGSY